ncbi:MAG TPA: glutathione-disulfide reductase [Pseudomonadales bacterium]
MNHDYDLFVIGAGSGGVRAARMSARHGARVAIAENTYLGGTCVNVGCVPKKLFVYGAHYAEDFEDAHAYGWNLDGREFHWPRLRNNKTREIERLNDVYENLLVNAGVDIKWGRAVVRDPHRVQVGDESFTARHILVATGSWPHVPNVPGCELAITSNEVFYLDEFPKRAVVVGGGYIAVEFAGIFAGLGAKTTLVYRGPLFLRGFDDEVREFVAEELRKKGVELRFSTQVTAIDPAGRRRIVQLDDGSRLEVDQVLYATGRLPNTAGLGLDALGVAMSDRGAVIVDHYYQSSVPSIFAIGDVIDRVQLTPVAIAEGMCIANNLFTDRPKRTLDYALVPTAVFCQPNIGAVGLTEAEARGRYPDDIDVYATKFRPMKHTLSGRDERTLMKLLVRRSDDKVVGAHMVGPDAGEIIQGIAVAMTAGVTKTQFDSTVGIHPTAAEEFVTMREPRRE